MGKITVYFFEFRDGDEPAVYSRIMRTAEAIRRLPGAQLIPGTDREVDEFDLDDAGGFDPRKFGFQG